MKDFLPIPARKKFYDRENFMIERIGQQATFQNQEI